MKRLLVVTALCCFTSLAYSQPRSGQPVDRVYQAPTTCTANVSNPVSYNGKVYNCVSGTYTASDTSGVADATATVAGKAKLGQLPTSTYAGLPTCAAGNDGQLVRVTDANRDVYSCYGTSGKWVSRNGGVYNVRDFGAVGDGSSHPLSGTYASVAAAAAVYPVVGTIHWVEVTNPGKDYASAPAVAFSSGSAVAHAVVATDQVSRVNITGGGTGYAVPPKITFSGGTMTYAPRADAYITNGVVTAIKVRFGGASVTGAPTVTIAAPDTTQATATFTVSGGVPVSPVTLTNAGLGYASGSTASISGCGVAPTLTVNVADGRITSITSSGGSGCSAGSVTISAPNGTQATGTADLNGLRGIIVTTTGSGYTSAPNITFSGGGGTGAAATAHVPLLTDEIDWAAAQLAVNALDSTYGGTVVFPTGKYNITQPIKLADGASDPHATFKTIIKGEGGATLATTAGIDIIQRRWYGGTTDSSILAGAVSVPDYRIANATDWRITGLVFTGARTLNVSDGSRAINLDSTFNLTVDHCYFDGFDTAIENVFGLMTTIEYSRFIYNTSADIHADRMLNGGFGSNSFVVHRTRHYGYITSNAGVRVWGSAAPKIENAIFEGYSPRYEIDIDGLGFATAVDATIRGIHLESGTSTNPPYTFVHAATYGKTSVSDIWVQLSDSAGVLTLVDGYDGQSGSSYVVSDVSNAPSTMKFRGRASTGWAWQINNVGVIDWAAPTGGHVWDTTGSAAQPANLIVTRLSGAANTYFSKFSADNIAIGDVVNSERFAVRSNGNTADTVAKFSVDSSTAYNLSLINRTYSTSSVAGRLSITDAGAFLIANPTITQPVEIWTAGNRRLSISSAGVATLTGSLSLTNIATASATGSQSIDFSTGNVQTVTFGAGNITSLTATNIPTGPVWIGFIQDGTGGRVITAWNALFLFASGTKPILSTAANARDQFQFLCDGTNCILQTAIYDVK